MTKKIDHVLHTLFDIKDVGFKIIACFGCTNLQVNPKVLVYLNIIRNLCGWCCVDVTGSSNSMILAKRTGEIYQWIT